MDRTIWRMRSSRECISALSHCLSSNWCDRLRHISSRGKILIFSTGRVPTGHKYWHMRPDVCGEVCNVKPLPCHGWKVICWPWRWQVHARGVWWGLQLRRRGCERGASAFMPVVCFTASPSTGMMKSKAAVAWDGKTKQPNPPGGEPKWTPAAQLHITERRWRSPLRPIKYSSDKRHPAGGSIPTGSSSTPPRDLLQWKNNAVKSEEPANFTLGNTWAMATSESLHATNNMFIAKVSHLACTMEHQQYINGHINLRITMTSSDWPHGSICWVNSKLSIKTPSMNPARPIWTAIRSQMCLVLLVGQ